MLEHKDAMLEAIDQLVEHYEGFKPDEVPTPLGAGYRAHSARFLTTTAARARGYYLRTILAAPRTATENKPPSNASNVWSGGGLK